MQSRTPVRGSRALERVRAVAQGLIGIALAAGIPAASATELIPGKTMVIKPGKIAKFVSKAGSADFPLVGDPTATGATLRIFDTVGGAGDVTYDLPAGSWKGLGNPPGSKGYKYKGSGCSVVLIKPRVIKAVCKESVPFITPFGGPARIILALPSGTDPAYCAQFGGDQKKNDTKVTKRKNAPPPAECPDVAPPTATATSTSAVAATATNTSGAAATATNTAAIGATATATGTPAGTATATATPAGTTAATATPTGSAAATLTPTNTSAPATSTSTPTHTPTPTVTNTPTIPAICQSVVGLPPIGQVPVTLAQGSTECGGAGLTNPPPEPPFSGVVADGNDDPLADLALGCLYTGGLPPLLLPYGSSAQVSVVGLGFQLLPLNLSLKLGGSPGSGPYDCTLGAGPGRKCANGHAGLDGMGTCNFDNDCGGGLPTTCALEPNCFFGPPIPVPNGALSACVMNAFLEDLCGQVNLVPPQATFAAALASRVYLTFNPDSPCPRCEGGVCNGGERAGLSCAVGGSAGTSLDCPPLASQFLSILTVVVPELTSGESTLTSGDGFFCPGQTTPGAIGLPGARRVTEQGGGPTLDLFTQTLSMDLAGTFCISATGTFLDPIAGLPAVGALSAVGDVNLTSLLPP